MTTDLAARLDTLETRLRHQRRFTVGLGVTLLAVLSVAAAEKFTDVQATSIKLINSQGVTRASLAPDPGGAPTLTFYTPEGIPLRAIGPHDDLPARVAELERIVRTLQKVVVITSGGGGGAGIPASDAITPGYITEQRLTDVERETDRQSQQLRERQQEVERAADRARLEQDQIRRDQERRELQRRIESNNKP